MGRAVRWELLVELRWIRIIGTCPCCQEPDLDISITRTVALARNEVAGVGRSSAAKTGKGEESEGDGGGFHGKRLSFVFKMCGEEMRVITGEMVCGAVRKEWIY